MNLLLERRSFGTYLMFYSDKLGTSSNTICSAGCAMSCVAMALATYKEDINGNLANPGNLNTWLNKNGGYASGDLIVWSCMYI